MSNSPNVGRHEFKGPIEGYVVNSLKTHGWRIAASMEHDDAMQEAYFVFLRCAKKYPDANAKHFMALFKMAWANELNDMATQDTKLRAMVPFKRTEGADGESRSDFEPVGDLDNDGILGVLMRQAPVEVQAVVNLFVSAPQEILDVALSGWNGPNKRSKTGGSARICKLLGLPADLDVLKLVEKYFSR